MTKILVIGYGNVLNHDDGVGIAAVEALQQRIQHEDCAFVTQHQPYPETTTLIQDVSYVVFIDASIGDTPGEINSLPLDMPDPQKNNEIASHQITPEWLLRMAERLYGHGPQAVMFTLTGQDFDTGEGLSDCVSRQLPRLIERVENYIFEKLAAELQSAN